MAEDTMLESKLDAAWRSTCKSLLGGEVGPMGDYEAYLKKYVQSAKSTTSPLSGEPVTYTGDYPGGVKFISDNERERYSSVINDAKLDLNEIKDIDSILSALEDRLYYSGNAVLGNSAEVVSSCRVHDSHYVYDSHEVFYGKYVAHSYIVRFGTYIFGSESAGKNSNFVIKGYEIYEASGVFECLRVYHSTHCIYSANLENCSDCLFCFNLRSKRRCIGNLELPQDKFNSLREKLREDICTTLKSKKEVPMLINMIGEGDADGG